VLQDQHFSLDVHSSGTSTGGDVVRALAEGDAVHIEHAYVEQLPAAEQQKYQEETDQGVEQYQQTTSGVPDVLRAAFSAPYILGRPFVEFLYITRGPGAVDAAFRDPPTSLGSMADPVHFLERTPVAEIEPPVATGTVVDQGRLDAVQLFLMLAARIPPHDALKAVDLWGGDAFVAAESGGKVCTEMLFAARSDRVDVLAPAAVEALQGHLTAWQAAMPTAAGATVERDGARVRVKTCDPGVTADQAIQGTPSHAFALVDNRIYAMAVEVRDGATTAQAKCAADGFVAGFTVDQLRSDTLTREDFRRALDQAAAACPR
jgi:hypothetical protein